MISHEYLIMLDTASVATVIVGGQDEASSETNQSSTTAGTEAQTQQSKGGFFGSNMYVTIALYAAVLAAIYFLMVRPTRKRDKNMREMQAALKVGDNVITSSGLYGVICAVGDDCFVVEFGTNKGIRIPIRKMDVIGVKTPNIQPSKESNEE